MPDKNKDKEEARGYQQYINMVKPIFQAWRKLQSQSGKRRKKAEPCLEMIDEMWGVLCDAGLKDQFESDLEKIESEHGYSNLKGRDRVSDGFYRDFKRMIQEYIHKPELGMGLKKNTQNQADLSPPIRWADRIRKRKLRGEFENVDKSK